MNILILAIHGSLTPHCETEFELAQQHLAQGDNVTLAYCNGELLACDVNPRHDWFICKACISKRLSGLPLLSQQIQVQSFLALSAGAQKEIKSLRTQFESVEELKRYRIENFDIGYGAISAIISDDRDPTPDLRKKADLVRNFIIANFTVFRSVQKYLDEHSTDRVYVHNGRHGPDRGALRACQSRKVDCFLHDYGCDLQHYSLSKNVLVHEINPTTEAIIQHWHSATDILHRHNLGTKFFTDRAKGIIPNWHSFLTEQRSGTLPADFDPQKRNIAIFSSSEDEFEGIDEIWDATLYPNQLEGVKQIVAAFANDQRFHFYFRLHPNLKQVNNAYTQQLRTLCLPNLTLIQPEAAVSTYALMGVAEKVVTFGSTMGIEAAYWGKPSILAGHSLYENLGSTYNPVTHEELLQLLVADLPPKSKEGALMFGYSARSYGKPYQYFKATAVRGGEFKGHTLQARNPWNYLSQLKRGFKLRRLLSLPFVYSTRRLLTHRPESHRF